MRSHICTRFAYPPQEIVSFLDIEIIFLKMLRYRHLVVLRIKDPSYIGQVITSTSNYILHVFHDIEILPDFPACAKYS